MGLPIDCRQSLSMPGTYIVVLVVHMQNDTVKEKLNKWIFDGSKVTAEYIDIKIQVLML